jgi:hypothetical protein
MFKVLTNYHRTGPHWRTAKMKTPASVKSTGGRLGTMQRITHAASTWLASRGDYLLMILSTERSVSPVSDDKLTSVRPELS